MADASKILGSVVLVGMIGAAGVVAASEGDTVFRKLDVLDGAEHAAQLERRELRDRVAALDEELTGAWSSVDVALRAARPIRRNVSHSLATWLGAYRTAEREALDGPVAAADTHRLLGYAAPVALPATLENLDVIRRADEERDRFGNLVRSRAKSTVELARVEAFGRMSGTLRADLVQSAREGGAASDLEATGAAMDDVLRGLDDVRPQLDFHRRKGTLARPVTMDPAHRFGQAAPLSRPTGLTYRPEEGREIHATGDGEVVYRGTLQGWGTVLVVEHGGGYRSVYAHLGDVHVDVGDQIDRADVIAGAGQTGSLDGVRTYYELRKGLEPVDPEPWIMKY